MTGAGDEVMNPNWLDRIGQRLDRGRRRRRSRDRVSKRQRHSEIRVQADSGITTG